MPKLILASASPRRKELLAQVGITPDEVVASSIDESIKKGELPLAYVKRMAEEKTQAVAQIHPEDIVIGSDTAVVSGRSVLPKAEDVEEVIRCLSQLSGKQHQVLTSVCVVAPIGKRVLKVVQTRIKFKRLTLQEINTYAKGGEGIGKAGGYAIQGAAGQFVKQLNGSYSAVVGLPLYETISALQGVGYGR